MWMVLRFLLGVSIWFASHGLSNAQVEQRAMLRGFVSDDIGASIPMATIEIHELGTRTFSDSGGWFQVSDLLPGTYHLHVLAPNHKAWEKTIKISSDTLVYIQLVPTSIEIESVLIEAPGARMAREASIQLLQVGRGFLLQHNANTLPEALDRLPGLTFLNMGAGIAKPVVRGMSFNRVVVVENGIKQEGQQWGADHGLELDPFSPERATVMLGSGGLMYGSDAMAGVVVFEPQALPAPNTRQASATSVFRSVNQSIGVSAMAGFSRKKWGVGARLSGQQYADLRVPAAEFNYNRYRLPIVNHRLKNTAGQDASAQITAGVHGNRGISRLTLSLFQQRVGIFSGAMGIPRAYQLTDDGKPRDIDIPFMAIRHWKAAWNSRLRLGGKWLEADVGFQANNRAEHSAPHAHGQGQIATSDLALGLGLQTLSGNIRLLTHPSENWHFVYGFAAESQHNRFEGFEFLLPAFWRGSMGLFGQWVWKPSVKLALNGGARLEAGRAQIRQHKQPLYTAGGQFAGIQERNPDISRTYASPAAAVGASWFVAPSLNIKANAAYAFRFPQPYELAANGFHHGSFRHEVGQANLDPERSMAADLGISWSRQHFKASVSPFCYHFFNYIYLSPSARFSPLPQGGQLFSYMQAPAQFWGTEVVLEYHPVKALHISAICEITRNRNLNERLPLPFQPPANLIMEAEYTIAKIGNVLRDASFMIEHQLFEDQTRVVRNEPPTMGYGLWHLRLGATAPWPAIPIRFYFQVLNLTNQYHLRHLSRYRQLNLPEAGRNWVVGIHITLNSAQ